MTDHTFLHSRLSLTVALVCALVGCSFETEALDDFMGTSCGHYASTSQRLQDSSECWVDARPGEQCIVASEGACGPPRRIFRAGEVVTIWCKVGGTSTEQHEMVPAECE